MVEGTTKEIIDEVEKLRRAVEDLKEDKINQTRRFHRINEELEDQLIRIGRLESQIYKLTHLD